MFGITNSKGYVNKIIDIQLCIYNFFQRLLLKCLYNELLDLIIYILQADTASKFYNINMCTSVHALHKFALWYGNDNGPVGLYLLETSINTSLRC